MADTATAVQFIREVFGPLTENPVFISSLPNAEARGREPGEKHVITRDTAVIADFVNKWDRKDRGLFFCVSTLRPSSAPVTAGRSPRSKANVAELALLHADIDLKSVEIGIDEIIARLRSLPLRPSVTVRSGNGVHAYWLLKEALPADQMARVEGALKQLANLVGGDLAVAEVSRLMRLPGTHNTKNGAWAPVVIQDAVYERRYDREEIEEMLGDCSPSILRKVADPETSSQEDNLFLAAAARVGFKPPINVEERLAAMSFQGPGESSIHQTQLQAAASLLSQGVETEEVVSRLMQATRSAAGEHGAAWNWGREEHAIRRMCEDWLCKNPSLRQAATAQRSDQVIDAELVEADEAIGGGTVVSLDKARVRKSKPERKSAKIAPKSITTNVVVDGVIEAVRHAGQDLLLTEGEVFIYADGIWHVMTPADQQWLQTLIQEGYETLGEPSTVSALAAAWKRLTEHPGLYRRKVDWRIEGLIAAANCMLDVRTRAASPHAPDRYARRKIGTAYVVGAQCPRFAAFLESLFVDREPADRAGLIATLQSFMGASLAIALLSREERKALILVGPSRTGKTELARIIRLLVGEPVATPSVAEISERFGLASLYDAAAWIRDDAINEGDDLDPQRFKTIVTGEPIDIERKHRDAVRGVELALPVLLTTNALPRARDKSDAIFNRSIVIEMTNVISEEDAPRMREDLGVPRGETVGSHIFGEEGPGILNWALDGLDRLLERGSYDLPESVRASIQRFKDDNNPVGEWVRMAIARNPSLKIARSDLLCAFHGWQREQDGDDAKALGGRGFFPRLRAAAPWADMDLTDGSGRRYVGGIGLTDEGLQLWDLHSAGPQLKGGSKGVSVAKTDVNKIWKKDHSDGEDTRF